MPYSDRMQKSHLYSVYFAPRGLPRMADLGMQIAQQYLSPFDKLIGVVGEAGAGKSMLLRGMFPGLELSNDDEGVNVRPLPLLSATEEDTGFYKPHTFHVDIRFELAFTQMHVLASAIIDAVCIGKRVLVEHFDMVYPFLDRNAQLLIGVGEEIIITRPTLFGPEPQDITEVVFKSIPYRKMTHTAEDICGHILRKRGIDDEFYAHSDVRHGFLFSFQSIPDFDVEELEQEVNSIIKADIPISYYDDRHILIGDEICSCSAPRNHVRKTGEILKLKLNREFLREPITERLLLVGIVGEWGEKRLQDLNNLVIGGGV